MASRALSRALQYVGVKGEWSVPGVSTLTIVKEILQSLHTREEIEAAFEGKISYGQALRLKYLTFTTEDDSVPDEGVWKWNDHRFISASIRENFPDRLNASQLTEQALLRDAKKGNRRGSF